MAGLPALAASWISSPPLWQEIQQRATASLGENSGLKINMDGRDAIISGDAASKERFDEAVRAVSSTFGVRRVDASRAAIAPAAQLPAPTVKILVTNDSTPTITGTWPESAADSLEISVGDKTYALGKDKSVSSSAGKWSLELPAAIPDGNHDIVVSVTDKAGTTSTVKAKSGLQIDSKAPDAPVIASSPKNLTWPFAITGTWPEDDSASLKFDFQNRTYQIGIAQELKSDGKGKFKFEPKTPLPVGSYDLNATVVDKLGNEKTYVIPKAVVIAEPESLPAPDVTISSLDVLSAPTVKPVQTFAARPILRGTWPANAAKSFKVEVAGDTYELGTSPELLDDALGNWMLKTAKDLSPATYDVVATATSSTNVIASDTTKDELVIKPPPPKPPEMTKPTIAALQSAQDMPVVKGTWDSKVAKTLQVNVAGTTYELGKNSELTSDASGTWQLKLAIPLAEGTFDVAVTTIDSAGISAKDSTSNELVVKFAALVVPTVDPIQSIAEVTALTGTWPAKDAKSLQVAIAGETFELGKAANLTSTIDGKWQLKLNKPLGDGKYDVDVTVKGSGNRSAQDSSKDEIVIALPPPPPPPPPKKLAAPTIARFETSDATPELSGTWPEGDATSLAVKVGDKTFDLGKSVELTSSGGKWTLTPPAAIPDGTYDVTVTIADKEGNSLTENGVAALKIDTVPPAVPTMIPVTTNSSWPYPLLGTWPEADAKSLSIEFNGNSYTLGSNRELTSDGKGTFTFTPIDQLSPGSYDMIVTMADKLGNTSVASVKAVVVIPELPKQLVEPAKPAEKPMVKKPGDSVLKTTGYDCATDLERITQSFPVRFEYRAADITAQHDLSLSQVASLLRDPRCAGVRIEVEGHTDFRGTYRYNQLLSELRAEHVVRALVSSGADASRLRAVGRSESSPNDPARTATARAKNRRVEFRVVK
jgi:outer membrane protein OmpA-like peptidoglycan-associated protein